MEEYEKYMEMLMDWTITFVPKLLLACLVLVIGFWVVKKILKAITKLIDKAGVGVEISGFLNSIINIVLKMAVILGAMSIIGFEVSSLLGILAAAAFAIGMALQGFMGNFASGITIVFFKPYKVGDWVEVADKFGRVKNIEIFFTTLETPGNKTLIIPNGKVTDEVVTNFTTLGSIRLELEVAMPYEESFPKVREIILKVLDDYEKVMKTPVPEVGIITYDTHYIVLGVRPFIQADDYWEATYEINQRIKNAFSANGVKMAYSEGVELGAIGA